MVVLVFGLGLFRLTLLVLCFVWRMFDWVVDMGSFFFFVALLK